MNSTPNIMKLGMGLAFIGAIFALVAMSFAWKGTPASATAVGLDMLVAAIFFAVGGCFSSHSPVKANTAIVLSALSVAFSIIAALCGAMTPVACVGFVIIGVICAVIANNGSTKNYIEQNRIA